jgi:hypothetical protein
MSKWVSVHGRCRSDCVAWYSFYVFTNPVYSHYTENRQHCYPCGVVDIRVSGGIIIQVELLPNWSISSGPYA